MCVGAARVPSKVSVVTLMLYSVPGSSLVNAKLVLLVVALKRRPCELRQVKLKR